MKVEKIVYKCNNCHQEISPFSRERVQVETYDHTCPSGWAEISTPNGTIDMDSRTTHFCSVDCLCEYIQLKAKELESGIS